MPHGFLVGVVRLLPAVRPDLFCEAPVEDNRFAKGTNHDVGRLELAMEDATLMSVRDCSADIDPSFKQRMNPILNS